MVELVLPEGFCEGYQQAQLEDVEQDDADKDETPAEQIHIAWPDHSSYPLVDAYDALRQRGLRGRFSLVTNGVKDIPVDRFISDS